MTIKDVAEAAGCAEITVKRWLTANKPGRMEKGKVTRLTYPEAAEIMEALPKRNMVGNLEQMVQAPKTNDPSCRMDRLESMVEKLCLGISILAGQPRQIDIVQDCYTIKGYANRIGQTVTFSEAITIGREAAKLSREKGIEIRKADDERFGQVNSYAVAVLAEVFQS